MIPFHRQEPTHARLLEFKIPGTGLVVALMKDVSGVLAKQKMQHIEEVDADVGRNAAGFLNAAFPRDLIPNTTALAGFALDLLLQCNNRRMQAQLQDGVDLLPGLDLDLGQRIDVPRVENRGFSQIASDPDLNAKRACASCR